MASSAHLDPSHVIDLRGNHDVFDLRRAADADAFTRDSATAEALGAAGTARRVRVTELPPRLVLHPDEGAAAGAIESAKECPAGVLVGIDATPDVRMHAFT